MEELLKKEKKKFTKKNCFQKWFRRMEELRELMKDEKILPELFSLYQYDLDLISKYFEAIFH